MDCIFVQAKFETHTRVWIVFGPGHNGADGLVAARVLHEWGYQVTLATPFAVDRFAPLTLAQFTRCQKLGIRVYQHECAPTSMDTPEPVVWIDALFGVGLSRGLSARVVPWVDLMNSNSDHVISIDLPSGVCGTTGRALGKTVVASETITFQCSKLGHWLFPGAGVRGELHIADIGISVAGFASLNAPIRVLADHGFPKSVLKKRKRNAHKGNFGHVGVLGGHEGMTGAIKLAGKAAMRAGVGRSTLLCPPELVKSLASELETVMCRGEPSLSPSNSAYHTQLSSHLHSSYVIGCGLDPNRCGERFASFVRSDVPRVLDAGALSWLARQPLMRLGRNCVMTPHPAEAGRLLGIEVEEVQNDRIGSVLKLQARYGCVIVLKGAYTVLANGPTELLICPFGNPGMATAGSGDVLAGIIGGLLAQGLSAWEAAGAGVVWHARAGDLASSEYTQYSMIASDLTSFLTKVVSC